MTDRTDRTDMNHSLRTGRRHALVLLAGGAATLAAGCATLADEPPEEGFEYRETAGAGAGAGALAPPGLEVTEYFWFGCPHCNALEPLLATWRRRQPPDVVFRKVHVALGPSWVPHQQLFYTLAALGAGDTMNDRVFRALHADGAKLGARGEMADFVARHGIDRERFIAAFDSPAVRADMIAADTLARTVGVRGVPTLTVNGRWLTSPSMAGGNAAALRVVDFLLERDRKAVR